MVALAAPAECEDLVDHAARALRRLYHLEHVVVWAAAGRERVPGHFGITEHGAEDVVEFVRDATRQGPDGFQALRMAQLLVQSVTLRLRLRARDGGGEDL